MTDSIKYTPATTNDEDYEEWFVPCSICGGFGFLEDDDISNPQTCYGCYGDGGEWAHETIKYTPATKTPQPCPKCGEPMPRGAVTEKRAGKPEMVTIYCACQYAKRMVIKR